ncbi:MAG: hypothetical protein Q8T04_11205 [Bacteroidota bacterium]|nr:hypothetical protein [Bacteroidota bacterium]
MEFFDFDNLHTSKPIHYSTMKKYIYLSIFLVSVMTISCSPRVMTTVINKYEPLDFKADVIVLGLNDQVPNEAELLGEIKVGDSGFSTKCTYEDVITLSKMEAMKIGGNVLKITKHNLPSAMGSSCHRIQAKILKLEDISNMNLTKEEEIIPNADFAILNIYRYGGTGALVGYDIYLGDEVLGRVVNNYKSSVKVAKFGLNTVWARTEAKEELPIDIEKGRQYYIRCKVGMGAFVGRPILELIDSKTGKYEFESFKAKHQ